MPRGFDVSTESSATVAEVHSAFGNADYWRDRLAVFGGDSISEMKARWSQYHDLARQR